MLQKLFAPLLATLFVSASFAGQVAAPETPGSEGPQAVAEARHMALVHGIGQPAEEAIAQAPACEEAQAAAEAIRMKLPHGVVNDSADRRMALDAYRL